MQARVDRQRSAVQPRREKLAVDRHADVDASGSRFVGRERNDGRDVLLELEVTARALLAQQAAARRFRALQEKIHRLQQMSALFELTRALVDACACAVLWFARIALCGG